MLRVEIRAKIEKMPQDKLPEPGEFTRVFKSQHFAPPSGLGSEAETVPVPRAPMMSDSPRTGRIADSTSTPSQQKPSEVTMIANGRTLAAVPATNSPADSSSGKLPLNVNISPMNPAGLHSLASSGSIGMAGGHVNTPLGSAHLQAPNLSQAVNAGVNAAAGSRMSDLTKMILFFAALAILAVILVVSVVVTQKS